MWNYTEIRTPSSFFYHQSFVRVYIQNHTSPRHWYRKVPGVTEQTLSFHVLKTWVIEVDIRFGNLRMGKTGSVQIRDEVLTLCVYCHDFVKSITAALRRFLSLILSKKFSGAIGAVNSHPANLVCVLWKQTSLSCAFTKFKFLSTLLLTHRPVEWNNNKKK